MKKYTITSEEYQLMCDKLHSLENENSKLKGYIEAQEKQLRIGSVIHWVAVKDSLPDTDEYVLVKCNNNMSEYFTNRYYLHLKTWDYYKPKDITHWAKIESPCA